jgi:hypothetical protein
MTRAQRWKTINAGVAIASAHPLVPREVAEAVAAMVEELAELRAVAHPAFDFTELVRRVESLERRTT